MMALDTRLSVPSFMSIQIDIETFCSKLQNVSLIVEPKFVQIHRGDVAVFCRIIENIGLLVALEFRSEYQQKR